MSKPRHRAPSATVRQWLLWTIAAVATPLLGVLLTAEGGGTIAYFGALLACFAIGTLAAEFLLGRPMRGFIAPPAGNVTATTSASRGATPATQPRALPAAPAASGQQRRDHPSAHRTNSGHTADGLLEISLLASTTPSRPEAPDRAASSSLLVGRDERPLRSSATEVAEQRPKSGAQDTADNPPLLHQSTEHEMASTTPFSTGLPREAIPEQTTDPAAPFVGAVRAGADGRPPDKSYRVKGNSRSKLYHTMQSPYYERTKATVWFRTAAEAERAGFSPWNRRVQNDN